MPNHTTTLSDQIDAVEEARQRGLKEVNEAAMRATKQLKEQAEDTPKVAECLRGNPLAKAVVLHSIVVELGARTNVLGSMFVANGTITEADGISSQRLGHQISMHTQSYQDQGQRVKPGKYRAIFMLLPEE